MTLPEVAEAAVARRSLVVTARPENGTRASEIAEVIWPQASSEGLHELRQNFRAPERGVVVWDCALGPDTPASKVSDRLRERVYPLVRSGSRFIVTLSAGNGQSGPRPLSLDDDVTAALDLEDLYGLLLHDSLVVRYDDLTEPYNGLSLTPIEQRLARAMDAAGITAIPQMTVGRHVVDFLIETGNVRIAVETDGFLYHDDETDRVRDEHLHADGITAVLHFAGRRIVADADGCAAEITETIERSGRSPRRRRDPYVLDEDLDSSQLDAVHHGAGPARVLAPAGAGKTKTMVNRVLELLNRGADPSSIVVLAFNRKAAEQLDKRLSRQGVPLRQKVIPGEQYGVLCTTFNAFGHRYLRDLVGVRFDIHDGTAAYAPLMREAMNATGFPLHSLKPAPGSDPLGQFFRALERTKADLVRPSEIDVAIKPRDGGEDKLIPFEPVYHRFEELRIAKRLMQYDDQIHGTIRHLLESPDERQRLQAICANLLVDEFQDLNQAQLMLVDILSRPLRDDFIVADDDQLIYGWRGARPETVLGFEARMPAKPYAATYALSTNYRCSAQIVGYSARLIGNNKRRVPKDIRPRPDAPPGAVIVFPDDDPSRRATRMVEFLRSEHDRLGCQWNKLAVLTRYLAQQLDVALALDAAEIPRSPLLRYKLFLDPTAELLYAYLRLIAEPTKLDGDGLRRLLNRPNRYISQDHVAAICAQRVPWHGLVEWSRSDDAREAYRKKGAQALVDTVRGLHRSLGSAKPSGGQIFQTVIDRFQLRDTWTQKVQGELLIRRDEGDAETIVRILGKHAADTPTLDALLQHWEEMRSREQQQTEAQDTLAREEDASHDAVVVGSIHSTKGREYASVCLFDYSTSLTGLPPDEVEEERRVYYVGLTRAQHALLITTGNGEPHRFIGEMFAKAQPNEHLQIARALDALRVEEEQRLVARARAATKIDRLLDGTELSEMQKDLALRREQLSEARVRFEEVSAERTTLCEERETAVGEFRVVEADLARGGFLGFWRRFSGERARLEEAARAKRVEAEELLTRMGVRQKESDQLSEQCENIAAEVKKLDDGCVLREHNLPFVEEEYRQELADIESELAEARLAQEQHKARLVELDVLGVETGRPRRKRDEASPGSHAKP